MKKLNLKILMLLLGSFTLLFSGCRDDDPAEDPSKRIPLINEDFTFIVTGNNVLFTTTRIGNVWFANVATETVHPVVDGEVTVNLPLKGNYQFTCNVIVDGVTLTSIPFEVVIAQDDLSFLNEGLWLYLSGGANQTKTWRMDINANGESLYFDGPLFYSGDDLDPYWAWNVMAHQLPFTLQGKTMTSLFNWSPVYRDNTWLMAARDYGTITFDGTRGTVTTVRDGVTCTNTFTFNPETMMLNITECIIPIDTARVNEGQFPNMSELRVFSLTDHSMQIGVKRRYEGRNPDGSRRVAPWVHVYNFIVVGRDYRREQFTFTEPVRTGFTAANLVGTWQFDPVMQDWIGWRAVGDMGTVRESSRLNNWTTTQLMATTLRGWGGGNTDSIFAAAATRQFVFNADGTCVLAGKPNTYTVNNGVITFGTPLTDEFALVWISLTGTNVSVLDVRRDADGNAYTTPGIWLGQRNDDKNESRAVHLVRRP